MKINQLRNVLFVSILICCKTMFAQINVKTPGEIRFRLIYGKSDNKEQNDIDITKNLGSLYQEYQYIIIENNWTTLFGDLVYNNGVTWKLNNRFTFNYYGKYYTIDQKELEKYPDLIRRLKSTKPSNWGMLIEFKDVSDERRLNLINPDEYNLSFVISDNDIITGIDGESSYMVPGSPNKFSDRIKSKYFNKSNWNQIKSLNFLSLNSFSIKKPIEEWYNILQLYKKYEEEGYKTITSEINNEKSNGVKQYSKDDAWSIPYEDTSGEINFVFSKSDDAYVIKRGEKVIKKLPKNKYSNISKFDGSNSKVWSARLENEDSYNNSRQLINSKGDIMSFNGVTTFYSINSTDSQIELIEKTSETIFSEKSDTRNLKMGFYESLSAAKSSFNTAKQEYKDYWKKKYANSSSGGVIIASGPRTTEVFNVKVIVLDKKFNVISTKTGVYLQ